MLRLPLRPGQKAPSAPRQLVRSRGIARALRRRANRAYSLRLESRTAYPQENAVTTVRFIGAAPMLKTPAQFADWMKSEPAKWANVVKQANFESQ